MIFAMGLLAYFFQNFNYYRHIVCISLVITEFLYSSILLKDFLYYLAYTYLSQTISIYLGISDILTALSIQKPHLLFLWLAIRLTIIFFDILFQTWNSIYHGFLTILQHMDLFVDLLIYRLYIFVDFL